MGNFNPDGIEQTMPVRPVFFLEDKDGEMCDGTIVEISDVYNQKAYDAKRAAVGETDEKFAWSIRLDGVGNPEKLCKNVEDLKEKPKAVVLSYYLSPSYSKGNPKTKYKDSTLFVLSRKFGFLEDIREYAKDKLVNGSLSNEDLVGYWREKLLNKKVKVLLETKYNEAHKNNYTRIKEILKLA